MAQPSVIGHIVWHDLLTTDVDKARKFYTDLLGWDYEVEHATEFVWTSGEADYPLILHEGEAHGGFIEIEPDQQSHWLAFVAVDDVDAAVKRSRKLDGTIERTAFDIPGVGRSAVVRDPLGGLICPFVASHDYPAPTGVFMREALFTMDIQRARVFYEGLFAWSSEQTDIGDLAFYSSFGSADDSPVAAALAIPEELNHAVQWVPYIGVADVDIVAEKAKSLGAKMMLPPSTMDDMGRYALLRDPTGALFGLLDSVP